MIRITVSSRSTSPLGSVQCPSLALWISFGLKCILSDIKMVTKACFLGSLAHIYLFFSSFYHEVMSSLDVKECFSDAIGRWILILHPFY